MFILLDDNRVTTNPAAPITGRGVVAIVLTHDDFSETGQANIPADIISRMEPKDSSTDADLQRALHRYQVPARRSRVRPFLLRVLESLVLRLRA